MLKTLKYTGVTPYDADATALTTVSAYSLFSLALVDPRLVCFHQLAGIVPRNQLSCVDTRS